MTLEELHLTGTNSLSSSIGGESEWAEPFLLPAPKDLHLSGGAYRLLPGKLILLNGPRPAEVRRAARRVQVALPQSLGDTWEVSASPAVPPDQVGLTLCLNPQRAFFEQGYELEIGSTGIRAEAGELPGLFYAACTLAQLLELYGENLPCLRIADWPDFAARGVMMDISRDKVPAMHTLYDLIDLLAGWKINQIQLYTEHTFAYRRHPQAWAQASPLTGQEIMDLDAYCQERFIELVPNQNSFGHLHRWLEQPAYAGLAEVLDGFDAPWGRIEGSFSLCPTDPSSLEFISGLYDELLPHFSSQMVNVGCDETFDLGQGRSKEACQQRGPGSVYLEFLTEIYRNLKARGRTMQFWGDIVTQHPELIPYLPRDLVALEWGYEWDHPFAENTARYAAAGIPFYVCPGTSSWCSLAGRTANALANLLSAAENGLKNGAAGYLITDWGDNGHWQFLPASWLGFAAGAAYAWALSANRDMDLPAALDRFAFRDRAGVMGRLAYDLGNVYNSLEIDWVHSSALFWILQRSLEEAGRHTKIERIPFEKVLAVIEQASSGLDEARMNRPDGDLVRDEYALTVRLMRHACRRGMMAVALAASQAPPANPAELDADMQEIITEFKRLWLARNRPGGLAESVARFEKARQDY